MLELPSNNRPCLDEENTSVSGRYLDLSEWWLENRSSADHKSCMRLCTRRLDKIPLLEGTPELQQGSFSHDEHVNKKIMICYKFIFNILPKQVSAQVAVSFKVVFKVV